MRMSIYDRERLLPSMEAQWRKLLEITNYANGGPKMNRDGMRLSRPVLKETDDDGKPWLHFRYEATFQIGRVEFSTSYRCGSGIKTLPTATDILGALVSDAAFTVGHTFNTWAVDIGLDTDSRKAFATWEECVKTRHELERAFGAARVLEWFEADEDTRVLPQIETMR